MEKIVFNAPLNHKANGYELMQIEVEKVISLNRERFEQLRDHPLEDAPEIITNRDLMYQEGNTVHCILFLDAKGSDGILVEAEGLDYARKSQFIPNARAIIETNDITLTDKARCVTARQDSGVSKHKGEHSAVFCDLNENPQITENARCLHTRMDIGVGKGTHKGERSGVLVEDGPRAILNPFKEEVYADEQK